MDCLAGSSPLIALLPIASFAIAAGGLAVRFLLPTGPAKQHLIAAVLVFLVVGSLFVWLQDRACTAEAKQLSGRVIETLRNEKRTYEEIASLVRHPEYSKLTRALDQLWREKRIGMEAISVQDRDSGKTYLVTVYYVRTF